LKCGFQNKVCASKSPTFFSRKSLAVIFQVGGINAGSIYHRIGSKSEPIENKIVIDKSNLEIVNKTIKYSQNSIKELLDGVFEFYKVWHEDYNPQYIIFKDLYVVCWAGYNINEDIFSEVDIQIINEGVRLFFFSNS
jgi:hypothetical protein